MPITITAQFVCDDIDELHECLQFIRENEPSSIAFEGDIRGFTPTLPLMPEGYDGDPAGFVSPSTDIDDDLTCSWCGYTTPYDDEMAVHVNERHAEGVLAAQHAVSEAEMAALAAQGICTAEPCIDPLCPKHGVHSVHELHDLPRDEPSEIQIISNALMLAATSMLTTVPAYDIGAIFNQLVDATWLGRRFSWYESDELSSQLLIVLWGMQDWQARGVSASTARAMCRGIIADAKGAILAR